MTMWELDMNSKTIDDIHTAMNLLQGVEFTRKEFEQFIDDNDMWCRSFGWLCDHGVLIKTRVETFTLNKTTSMSANDIIVFETLKETMGEEAAKKWAQDFAGIEFGEDGEPLGKLIEAKRYYYQIADLDKWEDIIAQVDRFKSERTPRKMCKMMKKLNLNIADVRKALDDIERLAL